MVRSIVARDIKMKYSGSFMGFFWAIVHPLTLTFIYTVIFSYIFKARIEKLGDAAVGAAPTVNFAVWLLAGLLPWNLFVETVNGSANTIIANKQIITKTVFPSEILPFTTFLVGFVNHVIGLGILGVLMMITGTAAGISIVTLPLYMILLFLFSLGLGWAVAAMNVFFRDAGQLLSIVLQFWFFATPVIYHSKLIPESFLVIMQINPFFYIVEGYRSAIISGYSELLVTRFPYTMIIALVCVCVFGCGGLLFRNLKSGFADVL